MRKEKELLDDVMRLWQRAEKNSTCIGPSAALEGQLLVEWERLKKEYAKLVCSRPS